MSTLISAMIQDLRQMYRIELIEFSEHLTKEQFKKLLFYCKYEIPRSSSSSFSTPEEIIGCLEEKEIISVDKVSFLTKFADVIGRRDLAAKLTRFEITRELMIYALNRKGLKTSMNSSTTSLGRHLAEMVDVVQDRVDLPVQGMIKSLLRPGQNVSNIFETLLGSDTSKSWNSLALRVATAAEIVWLVIGEEQQQENGITNALQVAEKLASHLLSEMDKIGTWEKFCQFVMERHNGYFGEPVPEPASDFPWQLMLSLVGKMKDTFFTEKRG